MKFFTTLSERAYKENDLSDLTYAMCESDICFKQFFLDFFFYNDKLDAASTSAEREHSTDLGRPDFWIRTKDGKLYIVEVKIWDGNHHFEQYYDILDGGNVQQPSSVNMKDRKNEGVWRRLGYIANYDSVKQISLGDGKKAIDLCRIATWKEFIGKLSRYDYFGNPAVSAYAGYVRRVCSLDDFDVPDDWKISIDAFKQVQKFDDAIIAAVKKHDSLELYTGSPRCFKSQYRMGRFFKWNRKGETGESEPQWGWIGAYYTKNGAAICIEFEDRQGWGDKVCGRHSDKVNNGTLRIYAIDSETVVTTDGAIQTFLSNVLLERGGEWTCQSPRKYSTPLLAMKNLPFVLEHFFIDDDLVKALAKEGYEIKLEYVSDQEVSNGHCGRYFRLQKTGADCENISKQSFSCLGWIGVNYNYGCKKENGKTYGDEPEFVLEIKKSAVERPEKWGANNWGWWCRDICCGGCKWRDSIKDAQEKIIKLVEYMKSNETSRL